MTANVTKLEENKVRLDVEVPPDAVRKGVEAKIRELGRQVRVPGFRPGKAPRRVIENRLGRDYIMMEALQEALPTWYSEAVVETDLRPIDRPDINFDDPLSEESGFKFSATVEVRPQAKLGEYKGVEVPRREIEVSDEEVDAQLEEMRGQFATLAAVEDRPAAEGDFAIIDFAGENMTTGQPLEGGQAEDYMLEIGRGELLEDFENNVVGMKPDERKRFGVTFPADYAEASLQGQSVLFNVHLKEIKERDLPELDDEFVKEASEFETLDELRAAVREQLEGAAEQRVSGEYRARVLEVVAGNAEVEVPDVMAHEKAHEMVESFERSIRAQGMDPQQYYQLAGSNHHDFEERVRPDAEDTVKKELVLDAVALAENITADDEAVMHEIGHLAEESDRAPEEIAETMRANGTYALLQEEISRQKALDFLAENATPVEMPEEEAEEASGDEEPSIEAGEETPGAEEEPGGGEAVVEAAVEAGAAGTQNDEREEKE
ncbi:MAG: Cell division trigger factor [uncultured Rubrobacteraceae bacterium]|uniref:Trigger factor n=1 Tax=uncultured Rubrobacteraceae bacterium TaxID=349277 RepID=A0A6J4QUY8_9ACTN|nr:MAG: Cell division trigger factor [uncultured Rubrobacteraceae bacterium]